MAACSRAISRSTGWRGRSRQSSPASRRPSQISPMRTGQSCSTTMRSGFTGSDQETIMAKVGFIGLGLMGTGFTKRLAAMGHKVIGYDVDPDKLRAACDWGVEAVGSPAEVAAATDLIGVCVTTSYAVEAVICGEAGPPPRRL